MRSSESIENLAGALVLAQAELENPTKDSRADAGKFSYRYASLPAILDHVRPALTKNGLVLLQEAISTEGGIGCTTRLLHVSGEWLEMGPLLMPRSNSPQDNGSIETYCRRYALSAALNIAADEDDDGAKATRRTSSDTTAGGSKAPAADARRSGPVPPAAGRGSEAGPSGITEEAAGPTQSAGETTGLDDPAEGEPSSGSAPLGSGGGGGSPTNYLTKDDQGLLKAEYGGQVAALKAYKARFGDRITRLADITYEMRDEMGAA